MTVVTIFERYLFTAKSVKNSSIRSSEGGRDLLLFTILIPIVFTVGCSTTSKNLERFSLEHSHSLTQTSLSGTISSDSPGKESQVTLGELGLDASEVTYSPALKLSHGPVSWSLELLNGQAESSQPFSGSFGGSLLPAGDYQFDTKVTSTRLLQSIPLDPLFGITSPKIQWLAGLDFLDYKFGATSVLDPQISTELSDLVQIPVGGLSLSWDLGEQWNLYVIYTNSLLYREQFQPSKYRDGAFGVSWKPSSSWSLHAAYNQLELEFDRSESGDSAKLDFALTSFELGATFKF